MLLEITGEITAERVERWHESTSKVMLKILQARLQFYVTINFQMFKLDLEKAEEPEIKLPISFGSSKMQENSRKTSTYVSLTTLVKD